MMYYNQNNVILGLYEPRRVINMLRVKLTQLLDDKGFRERKRITLNEVTDVTGISRATLTRIVNVPGYNVSSDTIEQLCKFLECTPGELLEIVDD